MQVAFERFTHRSPTGALGIGPQLFERGRDLSRPCLGRDRRRLRPKTGQALPRFVGAMAFSLLGTEPGDHLRGLAVGHDPPGFLASEFFVIRDLPECRDGIHVLDSRREPPTPHQRFPAGSPRCPRSASPVRRNRQSPQC
ncbi:Uncharacterised protein [Mycobacteroides abscessus subsp. massiliense]|nr:Uncharacterised protein [Mycobacteroides abscessus subsp. massiliense]